MLPLITHEVHLGRVHIVAAPLEIIPRARDTASTLVIPETSTTLLGAVLSPHVVVVLVPGGELLIVRRVQLVSGVRLAGLELTDGQLVFMCLLLHNELVIYRPLHRTRQFIYVLLPRPR